MPESALNVYVSIMTDRNFQQMVDGITKANLCVNYCDLSMDAGFIISDDWNRFGDHKPGIFVGHANSKDPNLSRKKNVAFMCFEDGMVYFPRSKSLHINILEAERIVAKNMGGVYRNNVEKIPLDEYLSEWARVLTPKG